MNSPSHQSNLLYYPFSYDELSPFKATGLERSAALREDIKWMTEHDSTLVIPECSSSGKEYAKFLSTIAAESIPKFICHYYNHYFARTAGGRMIGNKMAEKLLSGKLLKFYQWEGDVKILLDETRKNIDKMAKTWTDTQKKACLEETMACFKFGGALMSSLKEPGSH